VSLLSFILDAKRKICQFCSTRCFVRCFEKILLKSLNFALFFTLLLEPREFEHFANSNNFLLIRWFERL